MILLEFDAKKILFSKKNIIACNSVIFLKLKFLFKYLLYITFNFFDDIYLKIKYIQLTSKKFFSTLIFYFNISCID